MAARHPEGVGKRQVRRATIRDVAAAAGVSISTASKALNGQGKLRAETRDRVAQAARQLDFAPNTLAQALLAGRSFTVGLITTDSFGRFSIPVMLGAEDALGIGQISVFMCDTRDDPERERRYIEMLSARRVDGLIVTGRRIEPRPALRAGPGIPVVYAMTQPDDGGAAVLPDDEGGGRLAADHLLAIGRRRIAHVAGPERFLAARRRADSRRAPDLPRPPPVRPHHRAGAVLVCPQAGARVLRRGRRVRGGRVQRQ